MTNNARRIQLEEIYIQIAIIGVCAFLVTSEALYIIKTRKRIVELEKTLGYDGLLSIDEAKVPSRMHKDMLASLDWLRNLRNQIPTMNKATLEALRDELSNTHEMYCKAFGKDLLIKATSHPGLQLKQALLLHIEITLGLVERALTAIPSKDD